MAHPGILRSWLEWEIKDGSHSAVLVVETNLETRPDSLDFDSGEFDDLVQELVGMFKKSSAIIDRIRVVPRAKDKA